jgi:hypothetical protein
MENDNCWQTQEEVAQGSATHRQKPAGGILVQLHLEHILQRATL